MDVLTKHKISRLEDEIKRLKETNENLKQENYELKEYVELNQIDTVEIKLKELKEAQEKFKLLNQELDECRKEYERQINDVHEIKASMIKEFNTKLKKKIKKTK